MIQKLKHLVVEILKLVGALLLLAILVRGIAGVLLYVDSAKNWLSENEDGNYSDYRLTAAWFGGLLLWFWLLNKIKRAGMSDDDKGDLDRFVRRGEDENDAP